MFTTRPLAATLIVLALLVPCLVLLPQLGSCRREIFQENWRRVSAVGGPSVSPAVTDHALVTGHLPGRLYPSG